MRAKDTRTEADWQGFHRILAIGAARQLGILPTPPEVIERLKKEREERERADRAKGAREAG